MLVPPLFLRLFDECGGPAFLLAILAACTPAPLTGAALEARYDAWRGRPVAQLESAWRIPVRRRDPSAPGRSRYRADYAPGPGVPSGAGPASCEVTVSADRSGVIRALRPRGRMCGLPAGLHDFPPPRD